jgi:hypothetical protein
MYVQDWIGVQVIILVVQRLGRDEYQCRTSYSLAQAISEPYRVVQEVILCDQAPTFSLALGHSYLEKGSDSNGGNGTTIQRRMMYVEPLFSLSDLTYKLLQLYAAPNMQIAAFRRYSHETAVGPSHGLFQYTFNNDLLLVEALLALCLNRWIDLYGV